MTFEEYSKKFLTDREMLPEQADEVFNLVKEDEANEAMANRWHDEMEGYPPEMIAIVNLALMDTALEWIDANLPTAWFRPMFVISPISPD